MRRDLFICIEVTRRRGSLSFRVNAIIKWDNKLAKGNNQNGIIYHLVYQNLIFWVIDNNYVDKTLQHAFIYEKYVVEVSLL